MTLKLQTDTLDGLPEAVHGFYEKTDNGFRLKVDGLEDTAGLKSALQKEREAAKMAREYEKLGLKPDEILALKAEREKAEEERARKAGEFDQLRAKIKSQHEAELAAIKAEYEAVAKSEQEARVVNGLTNALSQAGATAEGLELLPNLFAGRARIETVDNKRVVKILDADGSPMLGKGGKDATFADLAEAAIQKYPSLFKPTTKAGGGTPPTSKGAGSATKTITRTQFDTMSQGERSAFFREGGKVTD